MSIEILTDYMVPVIVGLCLCAGYIIKHWVDDVDNKFIPTICPLLGVAVAVWINWPEITPEVILSGASSGLLSTGLHQMVKQYINPVTETEAEKGE